MGWDSFGMPAENAARQNKLSPKDWTEKNISHIKSQQKLGLSIDWDENFNLFVEYYKHQQEFFLNYDKVGLSEEHYVNWDPVDETVLAVSRLLVAKVGDQEL